MNSTTRPPFTMLSMRCCVSLMSIADGQEVCQMRFIRQSARLARIFHEQQVGGLVPKRVFIGI
jgi:hypothetical protein